MTEKPFTENMARQASAFGQITAGCTEHHLREACSLLGIDTSGDRTALRERLIINYAEGWD